MFYIDLLMSVLSLLCCLENTNKHNYSAMRGWGCCFILSLIILRRQCW